MSRLMQRMRELLEEVGPDGVLDLLACACDDISIDHPKPRHAAAWMSLGSRVNHVRVAKCIRNERPATT